MHKNMEKKLYHGHLRIMGEGRSKFNYRLKEEGGHLPFSGLERGFIAEIFIFQF